MYTLAVSPNRRVININVHVMIFDNIYALSSNRNYVHLSSIRKPLERCVININICEWSINTENRD